MLLKLQSQLPDRPAAAELDADAVDIVGNAYSISLLSCIVYTAVPSAAKSKPQGASIWQGG